MGRGTESVRNAEVADDADDVLDGDLIFEEREINT